MGGLLKDFKFLRGGRNSFEMLRGRRGKNVFKNCALHSTEAENKYESVKFFYLFHNRP